MDDIYDLPEFPFLNPDPWLPEPFNLLAMPQESINLAISDSDFETLVNLRLTNKQLCQHATPLLFRQTSISYEEHSLQNLLSISEISSLRCSVKDLTYFINDERRIHNKRLEARRFRFLDNSPERLQRRQLQRNYLREQQIEGGKGRFLEMMARGFKSLPHCKSLDIIDNAQPVNLEQKRSDQMATILRALAQSNTSLEKLYIWGCAYYLGGNGGLFTAPIHTDCYFDLVCLEHWKTLHLKLPNIYDTTYEEPSPKSLLTVTILQAAKNLENLHLELANVYYERNRRNIISWEELIGSKAIGRLRKLSVCGWVSSEASLTRFLKTSCREVREITMCRARLLHGSWDSVHETIHRELHALEWADLYRLHCEVRRNEFYMLEEGEDFDLLQDYLLGRVKVNPWQQMIRHRLDKYAAEDTPSEASDD